MPPTLDDLDQLAAADIAAFRARQSWLTQAHSPLRKGKQIPPTEAEWEIWMGRGGRGSGKLLDVATPIPTPTGWTTMGDIQPGDIVFDESGRQVTVTWVSGIQLPEKTYRLTFSDGATIDACADHEWVTWTHSERKAFLRSRHEISIDRFPREWPSWRAKHQAGGTAVPLSAERLAPAIEMLAAGKSRHSVLLETGISYNALDRCIEKGGAAPSDWMREAVGIGPQVRTTQQIAETLTYSKRGDLNHCIPQCLPLITSRADLPVPPYTLGLWLGDGTTAGASFSSHQDDMPFVREYVEADGFETTDMRHHQQFGSHGLYVALKRANLLGNKRVPSVYFRGSKEQRVALLRGLMDADGGVETGSYVSFTNTNKQLSDAVYELVVSLGMRATRSDRIPKCQGKECARAYRVSFAPTMPVFRLPRKANRVSFDSHQQLRRCHRMIVSITPIEPMPMRCIKVDGQHSTYLAGRAMIPTHNSRGIYEWGWWEAWRIPDLICHVVAPTQSDLSTVSFEGPVGLLSLIPTECLLHGSVERAYNKSKYTLALANGSRIKGFAATENGERLRGPQCHCLVGDEIAAWDKPAGNLEQAFNNAMLGLRLPYPDGTPARAVLATTPRSIPFLKRLEKRKGVIVQRFTSWENLKNLSPSYRSQLLALAGTQAGKQEIEGEYIDDEGSAAILRRSWIKLWPKDKKLPEFSFIIESYDCAASEHDYDAKRQTTDPTACIILGLFDVKSVLDEVTLKRMGIRSRYAALLCDAWEERLGFPDLLERARTQHKTKWGKPGRKSDMVLIESASSGISLRQYLQKWGVPTWPYNPGNQSKTMRAHAVAPLVKQGLLWVPESGLPDRAGLPRDWVEPMLEQICAYAGPGSTEHDDYVDCVTQALLYLRDRNMLESLPDETVIDYEEKLLKDQEDAERQYHEERVRTRGNPYAA